MSRLLSAGFVRLKKSRIFCLLSGFMFLLGVASPVKLYFDMKKYDYIQTIDQPFFTFIMFMGVLSAVFISLFVGTEYSDGTIRNKLIIGHLRSAVYLSNLLLCCAAVVWIGASYLLPCVCVGLPLLGPFELETTQILIRIFCTVLICIAYTALFTMAAMLIHNKASLAVVTVIGAFILLFAATYIYSALSQPKTWTDYSVTETGEIIVGDPIPNEHYVSGKKREFYEFLLEFLPSGQGIILLDKDLSVGYILAYDSLILIVSTGLGLSGFLKKDIK